MEKNNLNNIEVEVINQIKNLFGNQDVALDTPLVGKGGIMDSLTAVQLINIVEDKYGIFVTNEDLNLQNFATARAIVELIQKYIG